MDPKTPKARLASTLFLFLVATSPAIIGAQEEPGTIIDVKFEAEAEGQPGRWTFSRKHVIIEPGNTLLYRLDEHSTGAWHFKRVAIGENEPDPTDYIEASSAPKLIEFGALVVVVLEVSERDILIQFDGELDDIMKLGILLDISDGERHHTSRDPQVIVKPGGI